MAKSNTLFLLSFTILMVSSACAIPSLNQVDEDAILHERNYSVSQTLDSPYSLIEPLQLHSDVRVRLLFRCQNFIALVKFIYVWPEINKYLRRHRFDCIGAVGGLAGFLLPHFITTITYLILFMSYVIITSPLSYLKIEHSHISMPLILFGFLSVIYEEFLKEVIPFFCLTFPIYELYSYFYLDPTDWGMDSSYVFYNRIGPFIMHLLLINFHFYERVFFHSLWNCLPILSFLSVRSDQCVPMAVASQVVLLQYFFLSLAYLFKNVYTGEIVRQAREMESYEWHHDYVISKNNQRGERIYWVRRCYSSGRKPINGPKKLSVEEAFDAFNSIQRESFESIALMQRTFSNHLMDILPLFREEALFILSLILNMNELYRAKAQARAYYILIFSNFATWASKKIKPADLFAYLTIIYTFICDSLGEIDNNYSFEEWKQQFLGKDFNVKPLNFELSPEYNFRDFPLFKRNSKEEEEKIKPKGFKLINDFLSVGAGLFALLTIPSLTSIHHIKNHLYSTHHEYSQSSIVDIVSFVYGLGKSCYSLFVSIYISFVGNNFSNLFRSHVAVRFKKLEDCQKNLETYSLTEDNPYLPYPNLQEYELQLNTLKWDLKQGAGIMSDFERKDKIKILEGWAMELNLGRFKNRPRKAPMVLCLHGDTSIGKSSLTNMLIGSYATIQSTLGCHIDRGSHICERVYRHNPSSKHWDGCKSTHWCMILDDIASEKDLANVDAPSTAALLDIVGNLPFFPPMASLLDKGVTTCAPRLVIMTTNNKSLGAHQTHHCPPALQRRVNFYVEVLLNPDFATPEGYLDSVKASQLSDFECTKIWRFRVEIPKKNSQPDGRAYTSYKELTLHPETCQPVDEISYEGPTITSGNLDWAQFMKWYKFAIVKHDRVQARVVDIMNNQAMNLMDCETCGYCHPGVKNSDCKSRVQRHSLEFVKAPYNYILSRYRRLQVNCKQHNWYGAFVEDFFKGRGLSMAELNSDDLDFIKRFSNRGGVEIFNSFANKYNRRIQFNDGISVGDASYGSILINMNFPLQLHQLTVRGRSFMMYIIDEYYDMIIIAFVVLGFYYLLPFLFVFFLLGLFVAIYIYRRVTIVCSALSLLSFLPYLRPSIQLKQLLYFLGFIGIICACAYAYGRCYNGKEEGVIKEGAEISMPLDMKKSNWWERGWLDQPELHKEFKFTHQSGTAPSNTSNYDKLLDTIKKNTLLCDCYDSDDGSTLHAKCRAFAIDNNHFLINNHSLFNSAGGKYQRLSVFKFNVPVGRLEKKMDIVLDETNCLQIYTDVVLIRTASILDCKSVLEYFCDEEYNGISSARCDRFEKVGEQISTKTTKSLGAYQKMLDVSFNCKKHIDEKFLKVPEKIWVLQGCSIDSDHGDSGSCWVTDGCRAAMIIGIHMGSIGKNDKTQFCSFVSRQELIKSIETLKNKMAIKPMDIKELDRDNHEFFWSAEGFEMYKKGQENFQEIHPKASGAYIEAHSGNALCALKKRFEGSHTTEMHYHKSRDYWIEKGILSTKKIPNLKEFRVPSWWIGIQELNKIPQAIDQGGFIKCAKHYLDSTVKRLESVNQWQEYLGLFSIEEAVHGNPRMNYVDRLNMQTSAGFPIYKKKSLFLKPDQFIPNFLKERVNQLDSVYKEGRRNHPIFVAHQKDEFVSEKKYDNKQLRVFMGSPVDFTIIVRIYLLSFVRLMQTFRLVFESAVAIVVQGKDWTDLYNYITNNGKFKRFIAGDYKFYDKGMHIFVLNMACSIIRDLLRISGKYTEQELCVIELILQDTINCVVDYDGTLIFLTGSNPSGHPLTVLLNCIVGSLYVRFAYLKKFGSLDGFEDNIRVVTYGDDNVIGVSDDIEFTFNDMRQGISEIAQYTTADKQEEGQDYLSIHEVTFLKRKFGKSSFLTELYGFDYQVCPIELDTIHKILHGGKGGLTDSESILISLKTALSELAFHPKEVYEKYEPLIFECAAKFGLHLNKTTYECKQFRWVASNFTFDDSQLQRLLPLDDLECIKGMKSYGLDLVGEIDLDRNSSDHETRGSRRLFPCFH